MKNRTGKKSSKRKSSTTQYIRNVVLSQNYGGLKYINHLHRPLLHDSLQQYEHYVCVADYAKDEKIQYKVFIKST